MLTTGSLLTSLISRVGSAVISSSFEITVGTSRSVLTRFIGWVSRISLSQVWLKTLTLSTSFQYLQRGFVLYQACPIQPYQAQEFHLSRFYCFENLFLIYWEDKQVLLLPPRHALINFCSKRREQDLTNFAALTSFISSSLTSTDSSRSIVRKL